MSEESSRKRKGFECRRKRSESDFAVKKMLGKSAKGKNSLYISPALIQRNHDSKSIKFFFSKLMTRERRNGERERKYYYGVARR